MSRSVLHTSRFAAAAGAVALAAMSALGSAAHADDAGAAGNRCAFLCSPTTTTAPPTTAPAPAPTTSTTVAAPAAVASAAVRLLDLANADRVRAGLRPLAMRSDVTTIALGHSWEMSKAASIFHNDAYFTSAVKQRLAARALGENVAFNTDLDDTHTRLMNSPGHRANLLDPDFTVVGIGVVRAGNVFYSTENFVQPIPGAVPSGASAPAAAAPKPSSAPAPVGSRPSAEPVVARTAATTVTGGATPATDPPEAAASLPDGGSVAGSAVGAADTFELAGSPAGPLVPPEDSGPAVQLLIAALMLAVAGASGVRAVRARKG
ncbi:MAG TPA: CAP domain-containing protein [Acidimicrobiales bacterium]|nr:CAP domain-containing protein [Acidimicrobiales bacterium]